MTDQNVPVPAGRRRSVARRAALLASVAMLGGAVVLGGPAFHHGVPPMLSGSAYAAQQPDAPAQQPAGFADIVAQVKPAVISVRVKLDAGEDSGFSPSADRDMPFPPGSPMERFFRRFGFPNMPQGPQGHHDITGQGSGFFISADGYAVTNNHVVDHAKSVEVTTDDGKTYTAKVIGTDSKSDLALIKVESHDEFPFVKFAGKDPRVGDWVIAVGNPFGLSETVTAGIVSARGRDIGAGPYDDFIQIDAPINKGNSGGPSFNVEGQVVGVNTAIFSPSGGSVGIGFAIPAETVKAVVNQLKADGHVTRGWLGVQIQQVTPDIAESMGLKKAVGALVSQPQPDSPAAKAGIKAGDVITAVNGQEVKTANDLARKVAEEAPGLTAKLTVMRDNAEQTVSVTLGTMPESRQAKAGTEDHEQQGTELPKLGLQLAPAGSVEGAGGTGVVVTGVEPNSVAAQHGFETGDVILDVGGHSVSKPSDVRAALHDAKAGGKHAILMRVKSGEQTKFVALPFAQG